MSDNEDTRPTEPKCPHCGAFMDTIKHGERLRCCRLKCGHEMDAPADDPGPTLPPGGYELVRRNDGGVALVTPGGAFPCDSEAEAEGHAWRLWEKHSGLKRSVLAVLSRAGMPTAPGDENDLDNEGGRPQPQGGHAGAAVVTPSASRCDALAPSASTLTPAAPETTDRERREAAARAYAETRHPDDFPDNVEAFNAGALHCAVERDELREALDNSHGEVVTLRTERHEARTEVDRLTQERDEAYRRHSNLAQDAVVPLQAEVTRLTRERDTMRDDRDAALEAVDLAGAADAVGKGLALARVTRDNEALRVELTYALRTGRQSREWNARARTLLAPTPGSETA